MLIWSTARDGYKFSSLMKTLEKYTDTSIQTRPRDVFLGLYERATADYIGVQWGLSVHNKCILDETLGNGSPWQREGLCIWRTHYINKWQNCMWLWAKPSTPATTWRTITQNFILLSMSKWDLSSNTWGLHGFLLHSSLNAKYIFVLFTMLEYRACWGNLLPAIRVMVLEI